MPAKATDTDARLWEISENLHRADLTPAERTLQLGEWVRLKEAQAADHKPAHGGQVSGGRGNEGGVSEAARFRNGEYNSLRWKPATDRPGNSARHCPDQADHLVVQNPRRGRKHIVRHCRQPGPGTCGHKLSRPRPPRRSGSRPPRGAGRHTRSWADSGQCSDVAMGGRMVGTLPHRSREWRSDAVSGLLWAPAIGTEPCVSLAKTTAYAIRRGHSR